MNVFWFSQMTRMNTDDEVEIAFVESCLLLFEITPIQETSCLRQNFMKKSKQLRIYLCSSVQSVRTKFS
jgi:hypothetical protein